jgi:hypothetical protein
MTGSYEFPSRGAVGTMIHTFNPTLINELTFGVNRYRQKDFQPDKESVDKVSRSKLGIDFPQFFPQFNPLNVIPNMTFGGIPNLPGSPTWEQRWIFFGTNTPYTLSDNLSKIYGKHNLKTGIFYERTSRNAVAWMVSTRALCSDAADSAGSSARPRISALALPANPWPAPR